MKHLKYLNYTFYVKRNSSANMHNSILFEIDRDNILSKIDVDSCAPLWLFLLSS